MSASIHFSKDHTTSAALLVIICILSLSAPVWANCGTAHFIPKIRLFDGEECVSDSKIVAECAGNCRSSVDVIVVNDIVKYRVNCECCRPVSLGWKVFSSINITYTCPSGRKEWASENIPIPPSRLHFLSGTPNLKPPPPTIDCICQHCQ